MAVVARRVRREPSIRWRIDMRFLRPGQAEVGIVDHAPEDPARHPTVFISAYVRTKKEREWFDATVGRILSGLNAQATKQAPGAVTPAKGGE